MRHDRVLVTVSDVPAYNAARRGQSLRPPRSAVAGEAGRGPPARRTRPALFRRSLRLPGPAHPLARLLFLLTLALLLAAVAPGFVPEPKWTERRVGALGVPLPAGDGWVQTERPGGVWVATRVQPDITGAAQYLYLVLAEAQTVSAPFAAWSPDALAAQYLQWAIEDLTEDGVETGDFALARPVIATEIHAGRRLHMLRTVKVYITPWHPDLKLEAQELHLLFLPDFPETRTFYKILLTADCFFEGCTAADLDLAPLRGLLDGLRVYPGPPG